MSASDDIYLRVDGPVGWLVLNRPRKRNAITVAMWEALPALLAAAEANPAIKVVVVRGADETAFAAGADIDEFAKLNATPETTSAFATLYAASLRRLVDFPKPLVALIQGVCVGAGCGLATACDLRFADTTASFAIPVARLGQVYRLEDTKRLVDLIGAARTKELLFTGRTVSAEEAHAIGLVERLYAPEAIETETLAFVHQICARSQFSVRASKRLVRAVVEGTVHDTEETARLFTDALQGEDYHEGLRAFIEKRKPNFTFS